MPDATTSLTYRIGDDSAQESAEDATPEDSAERFAGKFATAFKPLVAPRRLLFLEGALGTGKTEIARALVQTLIDGGGEKGGKNEGGEEAAETIVPSPTFALLQPYETERGSVLHADLYRLRQEQTLDLGLEEALHRGFVMIEWAERLHRTLRDRLLEQAEFFCLRLAYVGLAYVGADKGEGAAERSAVLTLPQRLVNQDLLDLSLYYKQGNRQGSGKGNDKVSAAACAPAASSPAIIPMPSPAPSLAITRAFVLAAGLGRRMRAQAQKPKPLVSVGGKALLLHAIERLRAHGVERIFVNAHYRADAIVKACEGLTGVTILREPVLLETGGAIERALPLLGEQPFFALNADALCYDPPASDPPSMLTCLEEGWQSLAGEEQEASVLLALIEQRGARDMQARACPSSVIEAGKPFPLVFPVPKCEHAHETPQETSLGFRYIGVQVLTARGFRSLRSFRASRAFSSTLVSPQPTPSPMPYSLTEIYAHEAAAGRLFGLAIDKRWRGRWLHVGDRAGLSQARRAWKKLAAQG